MQVLFQGNPLTVSGNQLKVGEIAPNFVAVKTDLSPYKLYDTSGIKVVSVLPSIDTGMCQLQTKRFNTEASKFPSVSVVTISLDLPFAQERFCGAEGIKNMIVVSDYQNRDFATKYALLIDELKLLTRAVLVIDKNNKIVYVEYLTEITEEPNYDNVLSAVKGIL
ncbi:MAG: thiol peroxidase [Desulfovibrionaceae bacterium]